MSPSEIIKLISEKLSSNRVAIAVVLTSFTTLLISISLLLWSVAPEVSSFLEEKGALPLTPESSDLAQLVSGVLNIIYSAASSEFLTATYTLSIVFLFSYFSIVVNSIAAAIKITNTAIVKLYYFLLDSNKKVILFSRKYQKESRILRSSFRNLTVNEISLLKQFRGRTLISIDAGQNDVVDAVETINRKYELIFTRYRSDGTEGYSFSLNPRYAPQIRTFIADGTRLFTIDVIRSIWIRQEETLMQIGLFLLTLATVAGFTFATYYFLAVLFFLIAISPIIIFIQLLQILFMLY